MSSGATPRRPSSWSNKDFGQWGETLAAERYSSLGFDVLDRNWRCRDGEIDLIVAHHSTVVFVEVKTRTSSQYGSAAEAVGWQKQRKIRSVALQWLTETPGSFGELRFDVATVDGTGEVTVYESCF